MKSIGIIGLGWLGEKLAESLKTSQFSVLGTTTTHAKKNALSEKLDEIICFRLGDVIDENWFQQRIDYYIITIPPSASEHYSRDLIELVTQLRMRDKNAKIIYTSSTSVYGSKARVVDEESEVNGETQNAQEIIAFERFLQERVKKASCILRLGGLIGGDRHPINYLAQKENVKKPNARVNLIHREDVVALIQQLVLMEEFQSGLMNLVCPDHPTRKEFYNWVAEQKGIKPVLFDENDKNLDKVVNCIVENPVKFELKYKTPYRFPLSF